MRKRLLILLIFLALASCTVGPNYRRPPVETPANWRFEDAQALDAVNTPWWRQFGDPVLDSLIETALKENKDVRIAAARVEEFAGLYAYVRSGQFPQVGAAANYQRTKETHYLNPPLPLTADNPFDTYQAFLTASWEIDIWGKLRRATEAARANLLSTKEGRQGVILTVVTAVAVSYTDLLGLDKQLDVAERTLESREHTFRLFKSRYQRGFVSKLELSQAESEYNAALATVPVLRKLIGQQENALSILLGRNPGPIARGRPLDLLTLPAVPAGLPSQLLERRPDIRQAEQDLIAANAQIGVAKAQYFPAISLTGLYGLQSDDLSRLFTGPARTWTYALPVTAPIFTAGGIAGTVKAAAAVKKEAFIRYEQVIQQAFREVDDGLIDQAETREELRAQGQRVKSLQNYARLARSRYNTGYTSYIEVLDAERSLFIAELNYAQTQTTLFRALVNLYKSMGGGWVTQAEDLTRK
jgi:outer membrane protein, multidrug efflux system